jgi:hypothetical protein
MSSPPILTFAPAIHPDAPDWLRQHLTLIYQKLGNHAQAFQIQNNHIAAIKGGGSTTTIIEGLAGGGNTGPIAGTVGGVANHSGVTSLTTVAGEYGSLLVLNDASPVAVTLSTQSPPWFCWFTNLGAGVATLTPAAGTIDGAASIYLTQYESAIVAFDGTNWFAGTTPVFPLTFTAVPTEFLVSYDSATGAFAAAQPAFTDISGNLATSQLPTAGISATITTAALTSLGAQGSMTFVNGILTAQTPAT